MQLAARLTSIADDVTASRAADAADVVAPPLSLYYLGPPAWRGLHLGYAGVPEREIAPAVERLAGALERGTGGRARRGGAGVTAMVRSAAR
jgi:GntR family transcriptional regulator/MocR family aminotransferase